jgi:polyketide biosynthesis enoyl-CoA hydratase PksH
MTQTPESLTREEGAPATLSWERRKACLLITMGREGQPLRIGEALVRDLDRALDEAAHDPLCRMVVLRSRAESFCLGMDFADVTRKASDPGAQAEHAALFMRLLRRIGDHCCVVVAVVEGRALGGGVGLVAACDIVVADDKAEFGLPELLWGLAPATIMPFLIRRMGYQNAFRLALTTQNINVAEAREAGLVDVVSQAPDDDLRRLLLRLARMEQETIGRFKHYMRRMWILDNAMADTAVQEFVDLMAQPHVRAQLQELAALVPTLPGGRNP